MPISRYGGSDDRSAAADNTSAFNCRAAVAAGPVRWSAHAYGTAIDVNDVENPYIVGARVIPPAGAAFRDRSRVRPGMAVRAACSCAPSPRSAGSGAGAGLGRRTTSTSRRAVA